MEGDQEDEGAEYEALLAKGKKIARSVTRNPEDVKDLGALAVAAVFLERQKHPHRLPTLEERERFMNSVIHHQAIKDGLRDRIGQKNEDETIGRIEDNQSRIGQPEQEFDAKVLTGLVGEALAELVPSYRQLVKMKYHDEMTGAEIVKAVDTTQLAYRRRMCRALGRLRQNESLAAYYKQWVTE